MDQWPSRLHSIHISYGANMSFLAVFSSEDATVKNFYFMYRFFYLKCDFLVCFQNRVIQNVIRFF